LPFGRIAGFFSRMCRHLIIEFVPKSDSQVERMLSTRKDIFSEYTKENFENAFAEFFMLKEIIPLRDSERVLYLMVRKN
jgi:hypothetical protein